MAVVCVITGVIVVVSVVVVVAVSVVVSTVVDYVAIRSVRVVVAG